MLNSLRKMFASSTPAPYHRRWPRILMSEPARITFHNHTGQGALLEEICAGGARVKLPQRLAPGMRIGVQFKTSAGEQTYDLDAVVVHTLKEERGFGFRSGLCFVNANPRETQRLTAFVDAERKRRSTGVAMS